jgi:hypothetical protein
MPLLANIPFHFVQKGWWINYTNPPFRQHIWTATNVEALILLGIMGIVGSFASHRAWLVIRHYIQPAVQLPDPSDRLVSLSSIEAIQDIRIRSGYLCDELRAIWKEHMTFQERLKNSIRFLWAGSNQRLAINHSTVPLRFGLWAAVCLSGSIVLGVFIPYLLGEGLQGATIVTGTRAIIGYHGTIGSPIMNINENMQARARADWDRCFGPLGGWKQNSYCEDLSNDLPSLERREILMMDPAIADDRYQFLTKFGDKNSNATQLSQHTTLRDVGYNAKADRKTLYHELTCIPVPLDPFVYRINGTWQLGVPGLVFPEWDDPWRHMAESMILNTSNSFCPRDPEDTTSLNHCGTDTSEEPPQGWAAAAKWFQGDVDDTLPAFDVRIPGMPLRGLESLYYRANKRAALMLGEWDRRLETFLITFKLREEYIAGKPIAAISNDPIFAAHEQPGRGIVRDREVSAIGCIEIFRLCQKRHTNEPDCTQLTDPPTPHFSVHGKPTDSFIDIYYPGIQSVWFASHTGSIYVNNHRRLWDFYNGQGEGRARWQDDVEERFILSMLRTRHASQIAAGNDVMVLYGNASDDWIFEEPLLYRNNDFTNINIIGYFAVFVTYVYIIAGSYWLQLFLPVAFTLRTISHGLEISGGAILSFSHLFMRSAAMISSMNNNLRGLLNRISTNTFQRPRRSSNTAEIALSRPRGWSIHVGKDEPDDPLRGNQ